MEKLLANELLKPVVVYGMVWTGCSEGTDWGPFPQHAAEEGGSYILIIAGQNALFLHG